MRLLPSILILSAATLPAQEPFADVSESAGIQGAGRARGVSVCDFNNDGHEDLFVCVLDGPNLLYANNGSGAFTEVGHDTPLADAGPAMTALWADLDNDGDQDVCIGNKDTPSRLFRNDHGRFVDITASAGLELTAKVQAGSVFDYDGDGLLDVYLACLNAPNQLYRNLGGLQFAEVGGSAGARSAGTLAMGTLAFDYDLDGDQDLYLVHDGSQANVLLRNEGGYFTDVSRGSGADVVGDGMGVDAADFDRDGDFDLYVTNLYENFLLENLGDGTFRETAFDTRTNDLGMGWGTAWLDYDNDGHPDLYVANETNFRVGGRHYNNILYRNTGATFQPAAGPEAAISSPRSSYGTATADFNADGRPDLFVANSGQPSQLFRNTSPGANHWIAFSLTATRGNREAMGARLEVWADGQRQVAEVRAGGSFASQHSRRLNFGLGTKQAVDSVIVHWPGGYTERFPNPAIDRLHRLTEGGLLLSAASCPRPLSLRVFPNPATGRVTFGMSLDWLTVRDAAGHTVITREGPTSELDLSGLPGGLYLVLGRSAGRYYRTTVVGLRP